MDRRTVLKALAATPLLLKTEPATAEGVIYAHTLLFRRTAESGSLFDDGAVTALGTEYESFREVWETRNGQYTRRISQESTGSKHRIVSRDERHSWTFSDYNNIDRFACDDPNAIHLQDVDTGKNWPLRSVPVESAVIAPSSNSGPDSETDQSIVLGTIMPADFSTSTTVRVGP